MKTIHLLITGCLIWALLSGCGSSEAPPLADSEEPVSPPLAVLPTADPGLALPSVLLPRTR